MFLKLFFSKCKPAEIMANYYVFFSLINIGFKKFQSEFCDELKESREKMNKNYLSYTNYRRSIIWHLQKQTPTFNKINFSSFMAVMFFHKINVIFSLFSVFPRVDLVFSGVLAALIRFKKQMCQKLVKN